MALTIVQVGDPILRQHAQALTAAEIQSSDVQDLIRQMRKAMHDAPGVGLAAPQVGVAIQLAVIEDRAEYHKDVAPEELAERERRPVPLQVIINPTIVNATASATGAAPANVEFYEGCLSLMGFSALVPRERSVRVECLDEFGKRRVIDASGWHARILQHEVDHLSGVLYLDRMRSRSFTSLENWKQFWRGKPIPDVRSALHL